jgi:hypothetical protein
VVHFCGVFEFFFCRSGPGKYSQGLVERSAGAPR